MKNTTIQQKIDNYNRRVRERHIKPTKFHNAILVLGITIIFVSIMGLIYLGFAEWSYMNIAMGNVFVNPLIWGLSIGFTAIIIRPTQINKGTMFTKAMFLIIIVSISMNTTPLDDMKDSINDVRAVLNDELYIVIGEVIDTEIIESSSRSIHSGHTTYSYRQYFTLDNGERFSISVNNRNDYRVELGAFYQITALPNSHTVLEYAKGEWIEQPQTKIEPEQELSDELNDLIEEYEEKGYDIEGLP